MTLPAFIGSIDFKLIIGAFGVRVFREARARYAYTPAWPYFDVQSGKECLGDLQFEVGLWLLALPKSDSGLIPTTPEKRYWAPLGQLLTTGALSARIHDHLHRRVDTEARDADRRNRMRAG